MTCFDKLRMTRALYMAMIAMISCGGFVLGTSAVCAAQVLPSPSPSPRPSGVVWAVDGSNVLVSQHTSGSGIAPPEGSGFAAGAALSPMTPYDAFSGAPMTPGQSGALQYVVGARAFSRTWWGSVTAGAGAVTGSSTNLAYWNENLLPGYNPHLGSSAIGYRVAFPRAPGEDEGSAARLSLLGASFGRNDGSATVRAGYFDLTQSEKFVFTQAPLTNVTPGIGLATSESLGDGNPALAWWPSAPAGLPLLGTDLVSHRGDGTLEVSDASMPALPGTAARMVNGSYVVDRGDGTRYAVQVLDATTSGDPIGTTVMFGADARTIGGPQGALPVSTLGAQRETIVGGDASWHVAAHLDGLVDVARSWYDADSVLDPGSQKPGDFIHLALTRQHARASESIEWFRFEPRYATEVLPYGTPENIWSVAWSWPGEWLKSNYQLVDNTSLGANRQGVRLRYWLAPEDGPLSLRVSYAAFRQIDPATLSNVGQTGFVEGFFLPQADDAGTLGGSQQAAVWASFAHGWGTVSVDYVDDVQYRAALSGHPQDAVGLAAPQAVVSFSRQFGSRAAASLGVGRYAMHGAWAGTPVDFGQNVVFAGGELQESARMGLLVQLRSSNFDGLPADPRAIDSPDFAGSLIVVEERVHF